MRILSVENHPEFTSAVTSSFLADHEVVVVPTVAGARAVLRASRFDVVLVDYDLDDGKGDELVRWVRMSARGTKVIAVSARDDGNQALVRAGADTVCAKLSFSRIGAVILDEVRAADPERAGLPRHVERMAQAQIVAASTPDTRYESRQRIWFDAPTDPVLPPPMCGRRDAARTMAEPCELLAPRARAPRPRRAGVTLG